MLGILQFRVCINEKQVAEGLEQLEFAVRRQIKKVLPYRRLPHEDQSKQFLKGIMVIYTSQVFLTFQGGFTRQSVQTYSLIDWHFAE